MSVYRYVKECRVCSKIYYDKEISEDQFLNLQDNPSIELDYDEADDYIVGTAKIVSRCDECSEVVNSKSA